MHLILRHKSPLDGEIEEKHLKFPPAVLTDTDTHVYTAILHTNNTCAPPPALLQPRGLCPQGPASFAECRSPVPVPSSRFSPGNSVRNFDWICSSLIAGPGLSAAIACCLHRYDLLIDGESKKTGSLFDDFEPAFNPPAEIDDPEDKKPEEWVDTPKCVPLCWAVLCFTGLSPMHC